MQKLFINLLVIIISCSMVLSEAEAKRFGGGKSFGMTRNTSNFSRMNNADRAQQPAAMPQRPASNASKWLGPLAGLAIGGLLGSLFMSHGLGSGILSWLLVGGVIFLIWTFIRSRIRPAIQTYQNQSTAFQNTPIYNANVIPMPQQQNAFDEAAFLRQAKASFIRLQAAYDTKNLNDLREFTAPEVFAEIQLQLQERGNAVNQTDVVSIEAELLDITQEQGTTISSVLFSGQIREEAGTQPVLVKEIWHFRKDKANNNWIVTGIQQA